MKEISIVIENCEKNLAPTDFDLLCVEKIEHIDKVTNCSLAMYLRGVQQKHTLTISVNYKK
jgi:hypothetical protein